MKLLSRRLAPLERPELVARLREIVPNLTLAERFALLHELEVYRHAEAVSGEGSTPTETAALRAALPALLAAHGVRTLLDVPCGGFDWMREVDLADIDYVGVDIVPALVAENRVRFGGATRRFLVLDATRDALPAADLVLCRDLLVHLSLADLAAALRNFVGSGARLLLTNHYAERDGNPDILSGDFRPVNLCRPPFSLPPPLWTLSEDSRMGDGLFPDRCMALWHLADVDAALRAATIG
ncbi:MAG TPA: class I SAM-dependent methyltransferase [Thermoanaerobaculia bacterium]|nr:class I SAM-dependent methyltransferase [Thermoanaerobaculia bacterium]